MSKLAVICFYWEGDRWQSKLDPEGSPYPEYRRLLLRTGGVSLQLASQYVNNLYKGVKRFASQEFDFICYTNEPLELDKDIDRRGFPLHTQRGVLPRLYMFSQEAGLKNRQVLCLDLDVVIVGDLKRLMEYDGLFCARAKFKLGEEYKLDGDVMSFRAGPEAESLFWLPFIADVHSAVARTQGRERYWIRDCANDIADKWQDVAPGAVLSNKRHMTTRKTVPSDAAIVSCHGYPRPHQVNKPWIKEYWNE